AIEIDLQAEEKVWQYNFSGQLVRDANRLPNGNTLVTGASQLAEVTAEGKVVWLLNLDIEFSRGQAPGLGFYKAERLQPVKEYPAVFISEPQPEKVKVALFEWTPEQGIRYENASVPFIYRLADGTLRMYHGGQGGICSAVSEDGLVFNAETGVRVSSGLPDGLDMITSDPTVVKLQDGRFRMYYKGADGSGGPGQAIHTVHSAISEDGLNFEYEGLRIDSRLTSDRGWASVPDAIILPGGRVRMYYVSDGLDVGHGVVSAISSDGLNFTREGPVLTGYVDPSVIILPEGRYMMLAVSFPSGLKDNPANKPPGIYCLISEDGINFTEDSLALSGEGNIDPAIVDNGDGTYRVYYWNMNDNPNVIRSLTGILK
ncbi:hypothetical protein ACFLYQ_06625, partial [Chloroflexota bacterium]